MIDVIQMTLNKYMESIQLEKNSAYSYYLYAYYAIPSFLLLLLSSFDIEIFVHKTLDMSSLTLCILMWV